MTVLNVTQLKMMGNMRRGVHGGVLEFIRGGASDRKRVGNH